VAELPVGESDLVYRGGMWFLYATVEVAEAEPVEPRGFLGVEMGIVQIATDSDGRVHAGEQLNRYRRRRSACVRSCGPGKRQPCDFET